MADDSPWIADTQRLFDGLITKPTLKEKLLKKPPFRFLHDIISNLRKETGFPDCFSQEEEDSGQVKAKEAKLLFLRKLIKATEVATGDDLSDARPTKICAGLEPENTNKLLQALAQAGRNASGLDMADIRRQVEAELGPLGGDEACANGPPAVPAPASEPAAEAQMPSPEPAAEEDTGAAEEAQRAEEAERQRLEEDRRRQEAERQEEERRAAESQINDTGGGGGGGSSEGSVPANIPVTRDVVELGDPGSSDFVVVTQETMGKLLKKPEMKEKLLKKPPFRFIHDIVRFLIKSTGFPEGLYTEEESDSKNIKDTKGKLKYLNKLINCVAVARDFPDLKNRVNAKKIASGCEPENTNLLLAELARAAASGVDSRAVCNKCQSGSRASSRGSNSGAVERAPSRGATPPVPEPEEDRPSGRQPTKALDMPKLPLSELSKAKEEEKNVFAPPPAAGGAVMGDGGGDVSNKLKKTKTARKAPPKIKSNLVDEAEKQKQEQKEVAPPTGLILDDEEQEVESDEDKGEDQEPLFGFEPDPVEDDGEEGKLVKMLKLQQDADKKEEEGAGQFKFKRLASSRKVAQGSGFNKKNVQELRAQIQKICQSVNPLGKCIDYVYEDMDAMSKELQMWRHAYQSYVEKYEDEKKATSKLLAPLQNQLNGVEAEIQIQIKKTHALKGQLLRNDNTILNLLEQQSMVDGGGY